MKKVVCGLALYIYNFMYIILYIYNVLYKSFFFHFSKSLSRACF